MITTNVKFTDNISKVVSDLKQEAKDLPKVSLEKFRSLTPIKTGNARRNTALQGSKIIGAYNYSGKLDEGTSKQAPKGMVQPFDQWFKSYTEKQFRK